MFIFLLVGILLLVVFVLLVGVLVLLVVLLLVLLLVVVLLLVLILLLVLLVLLLLLLLFEPFDFFFQLFDELVDTGYVFLRAREGGAELQGILVGDDILFQGIDNLLQCLRRHVRGGRLILAQAFCCIFTV